MKEKLAILLHWVIAFIITFLCIYLFVFIGGWRFFESNDAIMIEIGSSIIVSVIVLIFYEAIVYQKTRIDELENRVEKLEIMVNKQGIG